MSFNQSLFTAATGQSFCLGRVLHDVHYFVFEDEEIRLPFPRKSDHVLVVVFDPAMDHFPIRELDGDWFLLFAQGLQIYGLLRSLLGRSDLRLSGSRRTCLSVKCHTSILHAPSSLTRA